MSLVSVGFGTAALGDHTYEVVMMALNEGFRVFDTAEENEHWYDQEAVGHALYDFIIGDCNLDEEYCEADCSDLLISTKIPPWKLIDEETIRASAKTSREQLVGFCNDLEDESQDVSVSFPLDVYYIHSPECWDGWHVRCDTIKAEDLLDLRSAWLAMEAVVDLDFSARRIGLSNVSPQQLQDIIDFVHEREEEETHLDESTAKPRLPDVVQSYADPFHPSEPLREICDEYGIEFVSYSTLGTQHSGPTNPVLTSPVVQRLAEKHHRSEAEVVLSWALQENMSIIPRSGNKEHIQQLATLLPDEEGDITTFLDQDDLDAMDTMKKRVIESTK